MTDLDLAVSFPSRGVIRLRSRSLFGDAENPHCRRFLEGVFQVEEISAVTITGGSTPQAELRFCPDTWTLQDVAKRIATVLKKCSKKASAASSARKGPPERDLLHSRR